MTRLRVLLTALLLALAAPEAEAQQLTARVSATRVGTEDVVRLVITADGGALTGSITPPPLRNLRVVGGPSTATQIAVVNGAMSQSQSYTWILQPLAVGSAEVGVARGVVGGAQKATQPITLEVVAGSLQPRQAARPQDPFAELFGRTRGIPAREPKVFIEATVSRTRLHVGAPLLLTIHAYESTRLITDWGFKTPPQLAGFWAEDVKEDPATDGRQVVEVEGERFERLTVLRKLLFPMRAGTLEIPAATLRLNISHFFQLGTVDRSTKPIVVTADPIPEAPGFSGAVGRFTARAALDRDTVALGEAATLRFAVEGSGNLKWVERGPEVKIPGAKVYPPQVKSDIQTGAGGMRGTRTWEYVIVPETAGALQVPALSFSYFDPEAGRQASSDTPALTLAVQPGSGAPATGAVPLPRSGGGALALRSDIDLPGAVVPAIPQRALPAALAAVVLLHGAIWAGFALADRRRAQSGRTAPRGSVRGALHDLDRAGRPGMTKEAAAALIEKSLVEVFGPVDQVGALGERDAAVRALLQEVHFIRYAPQLGDYSEKIRDIASRASAMVSRWA